MYTELWQLKGIRRNTDIVTVPFMFKWRGCHTHILQDCLETRN